MHSSKKSLQENTQDRIFRIVVEETSHGDALFLASTEQIIPIIHGLVAFFFSLYYVLKLDYFEEVG